MITHYEATCETMNKLMESMTAIESEKDSAALKAKLAKHRALLEQMRDQVTQYSMMREIGKYEREYFELIHLDCNQLRGEPTPKCVAH